MTQKTDLNSLLQNYANKKRSPYIELDPFIRTLEQHARRHAQNRPEWKRWIDETGRKVWEQLNVLENEGNCQVLADELDTRIFMPNFYIDFIRKEYASPDNSAGMPFPDENTFGIEIPAEQLRSVSVEFDLADYIHNPQDTLLPVIKINFPANLGSTLILSDMIPGTLLDMAILKTRNFLRSRNNKEFFTHKLLSAFQGKENMLRDILNQITLRPFEALRILKEGGEFSYIFWGQFCNLLKTDIAPKKDRITEEIAVLQSVYIIEVFNSDYKSKAVKAKESEMAFKRLDSLLEKPPYMYTLDDIIKFKDSKGIPLLGLYSQEALEHYLKTKTTVSPKDELPELLIMKGLDNERWFIKKTKMLPLCARLLSEARPEIRKVISDHWLKLLTDYQSEPSMENDEDFEKLLKKYLSRLAPILTALLEDAKLYLSYVEMEQNNGEIPESSRIFQGDSLIPLSALLLIGRKDLLTDTRLLLPIWYSVPVLVTIISFFRGLRKPKKKKDREVEIVPDREEDLSYKLRIAAENLRRELVPPGETLDSYLASLLDRWNRIITAPAKNNLTEDVNSLIRDKIRQILRLQPSIMLTEENLDYLANNIIVQTSSLQRIGEQDALFLYIRVYIIKLILSRK